MRTVYSLDTSRRQSRLGRSLSVVCALDALRQSRLGRSLSVVCALGALRALCAWRVRAAGDPRARWQHTSHAPRRHSQMSNKTRIEDARPSHNKLMVGGGGVGGLTRVAVQAGMRALPVECSAARVLEDARILTSVAGGDARNKEAGGSGWWFLLAANSRPRTIPRIKMRSIAGCTPVARMPCLHGVRLHIHPGALLRHARLCCGAARPGWAPQAVVIALPAAWVPGPSTLADVAPNARRPRRPAPERLQATSPGGRGSWSDARDGSTSRVGWAREAFGSPARCGGQPTPPSHPSCDAWAAPVAPCRAMPVMHGHGADGRADGSPGPASSARMGPTAAASAARVSSVKRPPAGKLADPSRGPWPDWLGPRLQPPMVFIRTFL